MIVTDDTVLLNMPKTGSSFARECLKEVYQRKISSLPTVQKILYKAKFKKKPFLKEIMVKRAGISSPDQHGGYSDIPLKYRNRKIISVIRDPQELLLSDYTYEWWKENSVPDKSVLEKMFPSFPDLSLKEYIDYRNFKLNEKLGKKPKIGFMTHSFVRMFSKNPQTCLQSINDISSVSHDFLERYMAPVHFLKNESLNQDLFGYLSQLNYKQENIEFILKKRKVNITQSSKKDGRESLIDASVLSYLEEKEAFLYRFLNLLGFSYGIL